MEKTAFVTGADRGLGYSLCEGLLGRGYRVLAGQYMPGWEALARLQASWPGALFPVALDVGSDASVRAMAKAAAALVPHLDLLVCCAGISGEIVDIRAGYDYNNIQATYNVNTLGTLRTIEALLPLLDAGELKRVCCVSSEAGSTGACWREDEIGYCMSKAALNMGVMILHNRLHREGYSFRLYHPGWMNTYMMGEKETAADLDPETAAALALEYFLGDETENAPVLRSYTGEVLPW